MSQTIAQELRRCTRCKREILSEFFDKNRKGEFNKTCRRCLEKAKTSNEKNKCEHGRQRSQCVACDGVGVCEHGKRRSQCILCEGSGICEHGKRRSRCILCEGVGVCEHKIQRSTCKICDPVGHLSSVVRNSVRYALKSDKENSSKEYLGISIDDYRKHIESLFKDEMSWENYGEWHIDHIIPLKYKQDGVEPTLEEVIERLHYLNTQPMWASENISKGNRYIG